jgi:nitrate reductase gamma subunit
VLTPAFRKNRALGATTLQGLTVALAVVRLWLSRLDRRRARQFDRFAFFFDLIFLVAAILAVLAAIPISGARAPMQGVPRSCSWRSPG